jgi:hypothetical protein
MSALIPVRVLETAALANDFYLDYFANQDAEAEANMYINPLLTGGALPGVFREYYPGSQHGDGLGSMLRSLFRVLTPIAKSAGKQLLKHGAATATNIVGDVMRGDDWKGSAKRRWDETEERMMDQVQNKVTRLMTGSGGNKRSRAVKTLLSLDSSLAKRRRTHGHRSTQPRSKRTGKFQRKKRSKVRTVKRGRVTKKKHSTTKRTKKRKTKKRTTKKRTNSSQFDQWL